MGPGRIDTTQELLRTAHAMHGAARAAFLDSRCGDAALRTAVESLLRALDDPDGAAPSPEASGAREPSTASAAPSDAPTMGPGLGRGLGRSFEPPLHRSFRGSFDAGAQPQPAPEFTSFDASDATLDPQRLAGLPDAPAAFRVGPYQIVRTLGAGAMGTVFEAIDERLGRRVALKAIRSQWRLEPEAMARLLREARILSALHHPSICLLFDYFEGGDGAYLVLEYVDGKPLGKAAPRLRQAQRIRVAEQIAAALVAAHAAGVVHRDLKPDNVMVTADGSAKVLDFGIARPAATAVDGQQTSASNGRPTEGDLATAMRSRGSEDVLTTSPGTLLGTPMYMSPEQASGAEATAASDMFAFGLVLHELFGATGAGVGGERAFEYDGDLGRLLARVRRAETRPLRGVDGELTRLVRDLTSLKPADRPTAPETARRLARRRMRPLRRAVAALVVGAILLAVAGAAKYAIDLERERSIAVVARGDAENLVSFMTEKLRDKLAPVGRLDVLGSVAEEVIGYYAKRDPTTLSEAELAKYAKGLQLIGEVQLARNDADLASAERAFLDALPLLTALERRRPDDGPLLKSLGAAHFWLGSIAYRRGDLDKTLNEFGAYRELAERLVAPDASNPEWQLELAYADSSLVQVHRDRRDQDAARRALDASLATKRRLVELRPGDGEFRRSLANGLTYLAEMREAAGDGDGALEALQDALDMLKEGATASGPGAGVGAGAPAPAPADKPRDADTRYRLLVLQLRRGELLQRLRRPADALAQFREGQDVGRALLQLDPSNTDWQRETAVAHRLAGGALHELAQPEPAKLELDASRRTLALLVERDPAHGKWSDDLANTESLAATVAEADRRWEDARRALLRTRELLDGQAQRASDALRRDGFALRSAKTLRSEARLCAASGDVAGAGAAWRAIPERLVAIASPPHLPERDGLLALALLELDRVDEAKPILERLRAQGNASSELEQAATAKGL